MRPAAVCKALVTITSNGFVHVELAVFNNNHGAVFQIGDPCWRSEPDLMTVTVMPSPGMTSGFPAHWLKR